MNFFRTTDTTHTTDTTIWKLKHELKKKSLHCTLFIAVVGEDGDDGEATGKRTVIINY